MADEFGQFIKGLHLVGDTITSEDSHNAVLGKKGTTYDYLLLDSTSGGLVVDATDFDIRDLSHSTDSIKIGDGTDFLAINADGSIIVTATDLDIRNISATQDNIAISDGTDTLAINSDGSINVSMSGAGASNDFLYNSANLVKDTLTTVNSQAPSADTFFKSILVSGAGLTEWQVLYGTTGSESIIASFWTTPSSPSFEYDIPDSLVVSNGETLMIKAYNRERRPSPTSDFTGFATFVKQN